MSEFLKNIPTMYINLLSRTDRKQHVESELKKLGINNKIRFNAIKTENGALGCSMSHLKCIELAKKSDYEYVFICEDDITFLNPMLFLEQLDEFLSTKRDWDVILVAGNNMIPYIQVDSTCIKVYNCQTTTGYIVKREYYDKLIDNYKEGIQKQLKEPTVPDYKIDKYWFKLQREDNWFLIIPLSIIQREDYSDIEKKNTNFSNYMLNYNKAYKK
jgi:GR25 family glycosyltransferase involved in LPS biosynthesis